jgi:uncharacterized protein (DUF1800 family)
MKHTQVKIVSSTLAVLSGLLLGAGFLPGDDRKPDRPAKAMSADTAAPSPSGVSFLTKKTRLWYGRSQVLCFSADQPVDESRYFSFQVDEKFLHVLIPPTLLPGSKIGYLRLRPLAEGHTKIKIDGASIDVDIVRDTAASTLEQTRPEIVSPVQGSVIWGTFAVGVEQLNFSPDSHPVQPVLRLPDGHEIAAHVVPDGQPGPHLKYAFTVEATMLHHGANDLIAVCKDSSGHEVASDPVNVVVINPEPSAILAGDCRDTINTAPPPPKVPPATPPKPFKPADLVADDKGNFGQVVMNPGENPPWSLPVKVPGKGRYVMVMTARGDIGGNALPTLAVLVDDNNNALSTARLATTEWQRLAIGRPFTLESGDHILSVRFRNGFNQGPNDFRRLYLAKYELLRIDPPEAAAPVALADNQAAPSMQPSMQDSSAMQPKDAPASMQTMQPAMRDTSAAQSKASSAPSMQDPNNMQAKNAAAPMASMMQEGASPESKAAYAAMMDALPPAGSFNVVFRDALDGQTIAGQVQINALCWWPSRDHTPPPTVDLLVNDKVIASQTNRSPRFQVDVSAFRPGNNRIQLQGTLATGQHARSHVETIILPKGIDPGPYRANYRFYAYDPAWDPSMAKRLNPGEPEASAAFYNNGESTLKLPDDLQGAYRVAIELRGTDFNGPAIATVLLKAGDKETKLADVPGGPKIADQPVGQINFVVGPKALTVRFANDAYAKDKGDRNLWVRSIRLEPVALPAPTSLPLASIAYPANGAKIGLADAVVANVTGTEGAIRADLLIDGQPQHLNLVPANGFGPVLLPLLTRGMPAGPHRLQLTAQDRAGHIGKSAELKVTFTGQTPANDGPYARALFLLNRFGYGPEPRELSAILTQGPHAWLEARLNETRDSALEENEQERLHAEFPDQYAAVPRAVQYLLTDANPVRARFLMWAENHFSTWVNKDGAAEKAREHDRFVELGVAPFPDLLLASATSPAMIIYLDQRNSVAKRLNENYAREIMELHTLGVKGGYTQKDVTTLADLLTGWTLADEAPMDGSSNLEHIFRYDPSLNSGNPCQILGMDFPGVPLDRRFDRVLTALNMLAAHPSCAEFISRKLVEHYVSDPAPPALVDKLAQVYLETGGDLRAVLLSLGDQPEFWAAAPRVSSPIDFGVSLSRLANMANVGAVNDLASRSGMGMFDRATPDGYPDADGYYVSSNALVQRWNFAEIVQNNFLNTGLVPNDWKPANDKWDPATTQRLVDLASVRITGNLLGSDSNAAAIKLVSAAPANTDARLHVLTTFLCQVPETILR